jgi:hypothetical protein
MNATIYDLQDLSAPTVFIDSIEEITLNICQSRIDAARTLEKSVKKAEQEYQTGTTLFNQEEYSSAFSHFEQAFEYADKAIKGVPVTFLDDKVSEDEQIDFSIQVLVILLLIGMIFIIWAFKPK